MVQLAWVTNAMSTSYSDFQNGSICNAGALVLTPDRLSHRAHAAYYCPLVCDNAARAGY
ncbi:hypothetical protein EJ05DRAFT_481314 [Pseudovirgaria hyperparasitica]|uniref:Uncharacterized protein n=1 Tax=Pseudovirgaria hyperparasitica TaxID=470096 RepID=A0A6A6VR92_9PEZI|nr:uncharacterized protein EJ05DRAFT_481314 [Pseudovirgaria hyperparasitica]KAF2752409.1 hypothetical protein EJ05DRAFT_481314 [Pseudovirgaria hyperparasitica]